MTFDEIFQNYLNYGFTRPTTPVPTVQGIGSLATPTMTQPVSTVSGISDSIGFAPSTSPTSSVGKGIESISMADVGKAIGFMSNPIGYGIGFGLSKGFESVTGKSPMQAIADAMGIGVSSPGVGMSSVAGTAADPGTMASEDPSGMGVSADSVAGTAADPSTAASESAEGMGAGTGGGSSGGSKIVCTMMNESYGFGSFRNKIWLKHSKDLPKEYEKGYHKIFLPLVKYAKSGKFGSKLLKKTLEHIAKHRTIDIKKEFKGNTHLLGRTYRKILEPICYWVGKLNG